MVAQVIGVICGWLPYVLLHSNHLPFLPESQRMALSMTLGFLFVMAIKVHFRLEIAEFTMFTPAFLVVLMMPTNDLYPVLRVVYCTIGIAVGLVINLVLFSCPANHWADLDEKLHKEAISLERAMALFAKSLSMYAVDAAILQELSALDAEIGQGLSDMKHHYEKKPASLPAEYGVWSAQHSLSKTCLHTMEQVGSFAARELPDDSRPHVKSTLQVLFASHLALLLRPGTDEPTVDLPLRLRAETRDMLLVQSALFLYSHQIAEAAEKTKRLRNGLGSKT